MSKNNFAITDELQLPEQQKEEPEPEPLTWRRFVRQAAGLRAVKQRKRNEKRAMNKIVHAPRKAKKAMKKMGISDKIQRGYNIAEKWKNDNNKIVEEKE